MARSERRKGAEGEREVARIFAAAGYSKAKRSGDAGQLDGDLDHVDIFYVEVRRRERLEIGRWLREVAEKCPPGRVPLLVFRRSRMRWQAALPLVLFFDVIREDRNLCALVRQREALELPTWIKEAELACPAGAMPAVVFRRSGLAWHVSVPLDSLVELTPEPLAMRASA